jgi:hypothetical protein
LTEFHRCTAFFVVIRNVVDPGAHLIAPHPPSVIRLQQVGRLPPLPHPRVEPYVVAVWIKNHRHAVVDG